MVLARVVRAGRHRRTVRTEKRSMTMTEKPASLPVLVNGDGVAECPHCGNTGEFFEIDKAVRLNTGELIVEGGAVVAAEWGEGETNFEHSHYGCTACDGFVELPSDIMESHS
jgi:hypothetical protein